MLTKSELDQGVQVFRNWADNWNGWDTTYPWSDLSVDLARLLMKTHPDDLEVYSKEVGVLDKRPYKMEREWVQDGKFYQQKQIVEDCFQRLRPIHRWMVGGRRFVDVSDASLKLLGQNRTQLHGLSMRSDGVWNSGYMMRAKNVAVSQIEKANQQSEESYAELLKHSDFEMPEGVIDILCYAEPVHDIILGMGVAMSMWGRVDGRWSMMSQTVMEPDGELVGTPHRTMKIYWSSDMQSLVDERGHPCHWIGTQDKYVNGFLNAFMVLNNPPEVTLVKKKKGRSKTKRNSRMGPVNGVKRLFLNEDGTRLAMRRIEEKQASKQSSGRNRGVVTLHHVNAHYAKTWVRSPLPHESIYETKQSQTKKGVVTLFKVRRWRGGKGGFSRGTGQLRAKKSVMVTDFVDSLGR